MLSLRELPVALISLQREVRREDESELAAQASGIAHFGDELTDFMETAALVSALDLVITVDTAVAHLAGSLGRPTWIMLPAIPDWRWLLDRDDSPWYPTARLFRQEQAGDWDPVLRRVVGELRRLSETVRADVPERRPDPVSPNQKPDAGALVAEGLAHHRGGRLTQAELLYRRAFELEPDNFEALHMLGVISHQRGDHVEALRRIDAALSGRSRSAGSASAHAEAFSNRSVVLRELYRFNEALASCERAIALKPDYATAFENRGVVLAELGRLEEALTSCERAISLEPSAAAPLNSRGTILHALRRFPEAFASYERAQALQPDFVDAHWNEALGRLLSGDFARGWEKFEWRWKTAAMRGANAHLTQPEWDGNGDIAGKTVLLHAEQGFGDTIQFARYVPMVAERGAKVILQVQPALKRLLSQIEGAHAVLGRGEVLPPSDLHCPLLGLPRVFATRLDSIPPLRTPLRVPPELMKTWETRLGPKTRPRIGIAWTGNPARKYDHHRSIPLQQMLGLRELPVQLVSLQKEMQGQNKDVLAAQALDVAHFGPAHTDFLETAALASLMDVVITVDTVVAHLAGSLGRSTWVLLPFIPDWRWLLDRDDSPWYPTVRLFRQPRAGDWDSVLQHVIGAWREGASKF